MMQITKVICPTDKYPIKCPDKTTMEGITVHNTYNDASAMAEVSYMLGRPDKVSFHAAVDNYRVVEGLPFDRSCYAAGDGRYGFGNAKTINIEICYSKSGGDNFIEAEKLAAEYIALLLKRYGWGIDRVGTHQMRSGKYCPHRTLDMGWQRFLNIVKEYYDGSEPQPTPTPSPEPSYSYIQFVKDVQIAEGQTGKWIDGIAGNRTLELTPTISRYKNDRNACVKPVQKYLYYLGYKDVGRADGIAGVKFDTAVKQFQRDNGCVVDGELTSKKKTWKKLLKIN